MPTLYERLGGRDAVFLVVDRFYDRVLADPRIERFFSGVDMAQQKGKQRAFLTMVFGGPTKYGGKDMRAAHAALVGDGLDDTHFDAVLELLGETLQDAGVAAEDIAQVAAIAESVRGDVLGTNTA